MAYQKFTELRVDSVPGQPDLGGNRQLLWFTNNDLQSRLISHRRRLKVGALKLCNIASEWVRHKLGSILHLRGANWFNWQISQIRGSDIYIGWQTVFNTVLKDLFKNYIGIERSLEEFLFNFIKGLRFWSNIKGDFLLRWSSVGCRCRGIALNKMEHSYGANAVSSIMEKVKSNCQDRKF